MTGKCEDEMLPKLPDALQELDKPINKTGSRGGGRTLTEEGMLFKDGFRKKHGAIGGGDLFHGTLSIVEGCSSITLNMRLH